MRMAQVGALVHLLRGTAAAFQAVPAASNTVKALGLITRPLEMQLGKIGSVGIVVNLRMNKSRPTQARM